MEPEGRGTRLFLGREGFGPGEPYQVAAHRLMGGGLRASVGERLGTVLDER
ncbi:hypothetical protein IPZ61_14180 [Streptomyces sioyaensis]|uniref:hypothetical protein n=1 Tax=Streptomyces sioyaensis TaxID=67364 RepID=UPI001F1FDE38|nr:hypothetical protein [Streptomyces sioyaensis]MCF3174466.1 hypothetical protein [Streptomyces sioyaensis]